MCSCPMVGISQQGDRYVSRANSGLSNHAGAELIVVLKLKPNSPPSMWLPIRGTSDMTEATHFSQCVHDQQRRLEAEDCDSIRCAQLISGGRRRKLIRPPCTVPRSRSPNNVLHSPSYYRCGVLPCYYSGNQVTWTSTDCL